jgi:acetyl-CoA carboxylase biotin carboxyl carrier protein
VELNFNEIQELLATLGKTDIEELTLKSSDFELTVRKTHAQSSVALAPPAVMPADPSTLGFQAHSPAVPVAAAPPVSSPPSVGSESKFLEITSPMVGTFYRAPAPDEAPFVSVGDRISTGQTVCIIEAMKLMNELEADFAGEIAEILVENSEPVEFGQVLMRVKPLS